MIRRPYTWRPAIAAIALLVTLTITGVIFAQQPATRRLPPVKSAPAGKPVKPQPQQILRDGSIVGQTWTGSVGVRETTEQIMRRAAALREPLAPARIAAKQSLKKIRRDRSNLPQNPDSRDAARVAFGEALSAQHGEALPAV